MTARVRITERHGGGTVGFYVEISVFSTWETMRLFTTQAEAETYAEKLIADLDKPRPPGPRVVKEYA